MNSLRQLVRLARAAGFDYQCFHVLRLPLDDALPDDALPDGLRFELVTREEVAASPDESVSQCAWYAGAEAFGFALLNGTRIVCLQWIWYGARYGREAFWDIGANEAVSMHIVTVPDERDRGRATNLKRQSARFMRSRGFVALWSRVWWTNGPSLRVNRKAGWQRVGTIFSFRTPWRKSRRTWYRVHRLWA